MASSEQKQTLARLGWDASRQAELDEVGETGLEPGRIATAVRGQYQVLGLDEETTWASRRAQIETPAVGDWALVRREPGMVIERLLTRRSCFVRKAAGRATRPQIIATNVDRVLIVTAVDRDLNVRRLERYLAAVWTGGAEPVIVVNKIDLDHDPVKVMAELETVSLGVEVVMASTEQESGLETLLELCEAGATIALVGSSGVGKSTIINRLVGETRMATAPVREGDDKGRHTTTRQELVLTPSGVLLIDTPGMRELGLWDAEEGMERTFAEIEALAEQCRFRDCQHAEEPGCSVRAAVENGALEEERLDSYLRLQREIQHTNRKAREGGTQNTKGRWKDISKSARQYHKLQEDLGLKGK